jgi:hypothetical protein
MATGVYRTPLPVAEVRQEERKGRMLLPFPKGCR